MKSLEDKIKELPPELKEEVEEFVNCLVKRGKTTRQKPTYSWIGILSDTEGDKSSVNVQHDIFEWRSREK